MYVIILYVVLYNFVRMENSTRSVFANDKFVKLKQDVTRQRERFEK